MTEHCNFNDKAAAAADSSNNHDTHLHGFDGHDGGHTLYLTSRKITALYIFPVVTVLGIVGNILIALIYYRSKKFSTNVYLIALSVCDTVKLANDFMYFVVNFVELFNPSYSHLIMYWIYKFSHYTFFVSATNTAWLTCAIAIDRWNYITHTSAAVKQQQKNPQHKHNFFYVQAIVVSLAIVVTSILINIPAPFFINPVLCHNTTTGEYRTKMVDAKERKALYAIKEHYFFLIGLLKAVLPFFLLVFLNYKIVRVIYQVKLKEADDTTAAHPPPQPRRCSTPAAAEEHVGGAVARSKTRITHMLLSIVLCFTLCLVPDAILTMMRYGYATEESYYVRSVRELTDTLLTINSATTFLICVYFSTEFRKKLKQLLKCADEGTSTTMTTTGSRTPLNDSRLPPLLNAERLKMRRSVA